MNEFETNETGVELGHLGVYWDMVVLCLLMDSNDVLATRVFDSI